MQPKPSRPASRSGVAAPPVARIRGRSIKPASCQAVDSCRRRRIRHLRRRTVPRAARRPPMATPSGSEAKPRSWPPPKTSLAAGREHPRAAKASARRLSRMIAAFAARRRRRPTIRTRSDERGAARWNDLTSGRKNPVVGSAPRPSWAPPRCCRQHTASCIRTDPNRHRRRFPSAHLPPQQSH